jgi:5-methyltetrahydrofolate--homocysteine methyltransferase
VDLQQIYELVVVGDAPGVEELVQQAVGTGVPPMEIISRYLIPAMTEVGARFERAEFFVPEMIVASGAMQAALTVLKPLMAEGQLDTAGQVVLGTVQGDVHDLGKNLVSVMLEGGGFAVTDLGADVGPEGFVETVREHEADIVGMSALMTTTMPAMERTMQALIEAGLRHGVKVLVGGAPLTQAYCDQIGADGYAPDAPSAVRKAKELLGIV